MVALLIGHSSATMKGLDILTGLIDADFQGTIDITARTFHPPIHIPAGSKIAHLYHSCSKVHLIGLIEEQEVLAPQALRLC